MKRYKHYKGDVYEVICNAKHSETSELLVIYKNEKGEVFARPYHMFYEEVECNGETVPRFAEIN